jgi:hypothetical protein
LDLELAVRSDMAVRVIRDFGLKIGFKIRRKAEGLNEIGIPEF